MKLRVVRYLPLIVVLSIALVGGYTLECGGGGSGGNLGGWRD